MILRVGWLLLLLAISIPRCTGRDSSSCSFEIHHGWKACHPPEDPSRGCSTTATASLMNVTSLPTTALAVLLDNQRIAGLEHLGLDDIYFSTNLALIPDIYDVGRDYYTLLYEREIPPLHASCQSAGGDGFEMASERQTIRLAGTNYRAQAWLNGEPLTELANYHAGAPGMFVRRNFNVTAAGGRFNILIEPPDHPGKPNCGQGGDHSLAKDGATAQFMLGWDWANAMPDRATGFYGSVVLDASGSLVVLDPTVQTLNLQCSISECTLVVLRILATFEGLDLVYSIDKTSKITLDVTSDWGETWRFDVAGEDFQREVIVRQPERVKLWWPHGIGVDRVAHLHSFRFSLSVNGLVSDAKTIKVGVRTINTFLDTTLQGQRFQINEKDIYLVGGNWITTDQALRYSASEDRYCNEIALHKHAGLNLIRVWGGGVTEQTQFFDCADRLGVLVWQEFWMTGDNNGRWAGNFSWPLLYGAYLANVMDTVKRLRRHPSLLFYGGCNECLAPRSSEWAPNPPRPIDDGIRRLIERFDPGRFYISSSMGGANKADHFYDPTLFHNRSFSLAYADGPYRMLLPSEFFYRNPGLPFKNFSIGFQPEIGSVAAPTFRGLLRFMSLEDVESGNPRRGSEVSSGGAWEYHKFQPWTSKLPNNATYDHVYAYYSEEQPVTGADWAAASQVAAYAQYQNLFDGYISHIFEYTSAVVMWKTQSPWPSLRGFLYDWYLESTGSLRGVRASLGHPVSVVFDHSSWRLRIVNRQIYPLESCGNASLGVEYTWMNLHGEKLARGEIHLSQEFVPAMSVVRLGDDSDRMEWPDRCYGVCFLRLQEIGSCHSVAPPPSWHWLTDPSLNTTSNFSQLGELRARQKGNATLKINGCIVNQLGLRMNVSVVADSEALDVIFYPTFALYMDGGQEILPVFDSRDSDIVIVPGASQIRILEEPSIQNTSTVVHGEQGFEKIRLVMTSWNAPDITEETDCAITKPSYDGMASIG